MTAKHRKTRKNIHSLSGIQNHDPAIKAHDPDRAATVTGRLTLQEKNNIIKSINDRRDQEITLKDTKKNKSPYVQCETYIVWTKKS
jgi:hypothetical protein